MRLLVQPGLVLRARNGAAKADGAASLAAFKDTLLLALEENERALSAYAHAIERAQVLSSARHEDAPTAPISVARQCEGASGA